MVHLMNIFVIYHWHSPVLSVHGGEYDRAYRTTVLRRGLLQDKIPRGAEIALRGLQQYKGVAEISGIARVAGVDPE